MTKSALLSKSDNVLLTPMGYRNKLINGNFDFWQRGTSQNSTGYGSDDRWANVCVGSTIVHSQQAFDTDQTAVPGFPRFFSRTVVTSVAGASNLAIKEQRIEDVSTLAGKSAVMTFWAKANATKPIAVNFMQRWGLAVPRWMAPTKVTLTTSWQKFTVTADIDNVPDFAGNRGALHAVFFFDAGSASDAQSDSLGQQSGTFDIARAQVEEGVADTPFETRPWELELSLCQRYFEKTYDIEVEPGTITGIGALSTRQASGASTPCSFDWRYKVTKAIVAPTITRYNPAAANAFVRCITGSVDCTASGESGVSTGQNGAFIPFTTAAGSAAGALNAVHLTVEAEI